MVAAKLLGKDCPVMSSYRVPQHCFCSCTDYTSPATGTSKLANSWAHGMTSTKFRPEEQPVKSKSSAGFQEDKMSPTFSNFGRYTLKGAFLLNRTPPKIFSLRKVYLYGNKKLLLTVHNGNTSDVMNKTVKPGHTLSLSVYIYTRYVSTFNLYTCISIGINTHRQFVYTHDAYILRYMDMHK